MTRETKIGLLVGLAFIIVIGILLSDHLTSATEPQQAQLVQVAGNVRNGVVVPGSGNANPPITKVTTPQNITPQQPIPTREELAPKKPPVEIVQIGGHGQQQAPQTINSTPPIEPAVGPQPTDQGVANTGGATPPAGRPDELVNDNIAEIAKSVGEEIVPAGQAGQKTLPSRASLAAGLPAGAKQYKAEPGDSVSKIAAKCLGGNTKANRDVIIAANPSLQQNANMVVAGRAYIIPAASNAAPAAAVVPQATDVATNERPVESKPEYFYTVKSGDTLTRIAVEQLGSAAAVAAIKDLNKDSLKGGDIIHPNMKLRLPARPVASAQ